MKLFILIAAFIGLFSSAHADQCVTVFDICGIITDESSCELIDECSWDADEGCAAPDVCSKFDTEEKCDKDDICAWDIDGQCDEANLVGCLISPEYLSCIFSEAFFDFDTDYEALAAERVCECATGQLACLNAEDCFSLYDDLMAQAGAPADSPGLCEITVESFSTQLDMKDKTCGGLCDQDFGYATGNATWDMALKFDKELTEDEVEEAVASSIVGVELSDVTATEIKSGGKSADVTLMAKESEFDIVITIPAGRPVSSERLDQISKDLDEIEDNKYLKEATGAKTTVTSAAQQTSASGVSKTSGAAGIAFSMVSMIFVAILAIIA